MEAIKGHTQRATNIQIMINTRLQDYDIRSETVAGVAIICGMSCYNDGTTLFIANHNDMFTTPEIAIYN